MQVLSRGFLLNYKCINSPTWRPHSTKQPDGYGSIHVTLSADVQWTQGILYTIEKTRDMISYIN